MTAPKFEKQNHHYVPQFWQRGFRATNGHLFARIGNKVKIVSTKSTMQVDWLYTIFDNQWRPSDALEDAFSAIEGHDAQLLQRLHTPGYITTSDDEAQLCALLGLQASRHPDVLQRGHNLSREFGKLLASVHDVSLEEFLALVGSYGIDPSDGHDLYISLKSRTKAQLAEELAAMLQLSPQSGQLPLQDAIRAAPKIEATIAGMQLRLLDAVPPLAFVLGDTPIPQSNLILGFSVPLSKSLAVIATSAGPGKSPMTRRVATRQEVGGINRIQFENALETVIGPSADLLKSL
ncbi:DUF4238 domain-containing protein [Mesorhizobium sp. CA12]|uniref:DUF4238 domain-containing protein n=1 Tax=Mesorhizobium sp. CA12 TaxID=2876644 RepID=UPI001CCE7DF9|nr:DUF4238 domain-containing protein [Mesorhizobium sp. CA12]MBZ9863325.1 DUF4238 domain-containing protein [Mesorhizobium sp. CA12]